MKGVRRPDVDRQQVGLTVLGFAAAGLDKVTLRNVAMNLGMEAMSLYHKRRVGGKRDLIAAGVEQLVEPHIAEALAAADVEGRRDVVNETRELLIADAVSGGDRLVPEELLRMLGIPVQVPEGEEAGQ